MNPALASILVLSQEHRCRGSEIGFFFNKSSRLFLTVREKWRRNVGMQRESRRKESDGVKVGAEEESNNRIKYES